MKKEKEREGTKGIKRERDNSGLIAEWFRASDISHSEWMVSISNPGEGRNYFYSRVGYGGLRATRIDGYSTSGDYHHCMVWYLNAI